MSKQTRSPKEFYEKYIKTEFQINTAVNFSTSKKALIIADELSKEAGNFSSVSASGDDAVKGLITAVHKFGAKLNMYATAANLYGSQVEPLYETAKQQLEEIKKQDKYYRELCNNGPDKEADKYQKKDVDDIKFDKEKYQRDLDKWNKLLDTMENQLQSMCDNLDSILSQLESAGNTSIEEATTDGFKTSIPEVIKFSDYSLENFWSNLKDNITDFLNDMQQMKNDMNELTDKDKELLDSYKDNPAALQQIISIGYAENPDLLQKAYEYCKNQGYFDSNGNNASENVEVPTNQTDMNQNMSYAQKETINHMFDNMNNDQLLDQYYTIQQELVQEYSENTEEYFNKIKDELKDRGINIPSEEGSGIPDFNYQPIANDDNNTKKEDYDWEKAFDEAAGHPFDTNESNSKMEEVVAEKRVIPASETSVPGSFNENPRMKAEREAQIRAQEIYKQQQASKVVQNELNSNSSEVKKEISNQQGPNTSSVLPQHQTDSNEKHYQGMSDDDLMKLYERAIASGNVNVQDGALKHMSNDKLTEIYKSAQSDKLKRKLEAIARSRANNN